MCLVTRELRYDRNKLVNNLLRAIHGVIREEEAYLIEGAIAEILAGMEFEDVFYAQILEKMIIVDDAHIHVNLKYLPFVWKFALIPDADSAS